MTSELKSEMVGSSPTMTCFEFRISAEPVIGPAKRPGPVAASGMTGRVSEGP